ncbi:DmsE family decaheme c-type cytochrome [Rhodopseudomonas sp.]|uniref:DmsE family decaheme c-type cytochrome n=1 Tax=Rhodopseudomonas sp. TaxID=1078 RepID=UPI0039C8E0A0
MNHAGRPPIGDPAIGGLAIGGQGGASLTVPILAARGRIPAFLTALAMAPLAFAALVIVTLVSALPVPAKADEAVRVDGPAWLDSGPTLAANIDPDVAALADYAAEKLSGPGAKPNFSPAQPDYAAVAAHAGLGHGAGLAAPHGASPHGAGGHGAARRFTTLLDEGADRGPPTLALPEDPMLKTVAEYARLQAAMRLATAAEQRILRGHEQRRLRAQRAPREPDYVALMPQPREELVKTWVALENLEDALLDDTPQSTPQLDFIQILAGKNDSWKPILIAVQKQTAVAAGGSARAPMVAPAPGDPDGRYFVGSKPCETCHAGLFDEFQQTVMGRNIKSGKVTPQGKMECETCHGPGSAHVNGGGGREKGGIRSFRLTDSRGVDVADFNGVCLSCHEKGDQTYWQSSAHESRGLACVNCHTVMRRVSPRNQLKTELVMDTCFQCHKDRKAQAQRTSHMPIRENKITCVNCHNPHGSASEKLLREATVNDTCYQCHADKRGPFLFEHPPVRENCLNCHEPHGSNHESLLIVARQRLCQQCHSNPHNQPGLPASARWAVGNACQNCHTNIHGSNAPSGSRWHR